MTSKAHSLKTIVDKAWCPLCGVGCGNPCVVWKDAFRWRPVTYVHAARSREFSKTNSKPQEGREK